MGHMIGHTPTFDRQVTVADRRIHCEHGPAPGDLSTISLHAVSLRDLPSATRVHLTSCAATHPNPNSTRLPAARHKTSSHERLAVSSTIVICTHRTDAYGRYLADLKYLPGERDPTVVVDKGVYLNRELLERGLARRSIA
jgi:hypothetical protein